MRKSNDEPIALFIDLDGVAWNFAKAFVSGANLTLHKEVDWKEVKRYDFLDKFPELTKERKISLLDSNLVFNELEYIEDFKDIINEISRYRKVYFVSVCGINTVRRKFDKIQMDFPYATFIPIIYHKDQLPSKRVVDMSNGIFIDDVSQNLFDSNAKEKICFNYLGLDVDWSRDWSGLAWNHWRKNVEGIQLKHRLGIK